MKIVMDYRKYDGVVGGVERGIIEITHYLAGQGNAVVLLPRASRLHEVQRQFAGVANLKIIPLEVRSHLMSLNNARLDSTFIQNLAREEGAHVIHFPYNWSFPFRKSVPCLLTVHDVIPLSFREAQGFLTNHLLYRPGMRIATRLNDFIATVSEFSRHDISRRLGVPLDNIKAIPNGLRPPLKPNPSLDAKLIQRFQLKDGFALYVGGIHKRKNVARLIHAFANLANSHGFSGKLLVTGSVSGAPYQLKMKRTLDNVVRETELEKQVVFTGFVTDEELETLMRLSLFLVYPSLYEGFGIPILEAMQIGTPVITSKLTAMPEVAGEAALLVDPYCVNDITEAMVRLLKDEKLRTRLIRLGKKRASAYSWKRTAEEYLNLYKSVAGRQSSGHAANGKFHSDQA